MLSRPVTFDPSFVSGDRGRGSLCVHLGCGFNAALAVVRNQPLQLRQTGSVASARTQPLPAPQTEADTFLAPREAPPPRRGRFPGPAHPPFFCLSLFRPSFSLGDPPGPGPGSFLFAPPCEPASQWEDLSAPPSPSRSLAYLCPIAGQLAPFSASLPPGAAFSGPHRAHSVAP